MTTENKTEKCVCDELTALPHYGRDDGVRMFGYFTVGGSMLWYVPPSIAITGAQLELIATDGTLPELCGIANSTTYDRPVAMFYHEYLDYETHVPVD